MMGLFLQREFGGRASPEVSGGAGGFVARDQWMGIYLNGDSRVGYLRMRSEEVPRDGLPGYRMLLDASLETALFGTVVGMDISGDAWTAQSGERAEFDFSMDASDTHMGLRGTVSDGHLKGFLDTGGEAIPLDLPVDTRLVLGSGMGLPSDSMPILEVGESTTVESFDPVAMKIADATITCTRMDTLEISGESVEARVYETVLGAMTSEAWVDTGGEVLQASTPFGFTLRKIDPKELIDAETPDANSDLIQSLAIVPSGEPVKIDASRLRVRANGVPETAFPHDPPWQLRDGDQLTMQQPDGFPVEAPEDRTADMSAFLGGDAFVATDHPAIQAEARAIVGEERDPARKARLIYTWVYEEIEKVPVLSVPNAVDVLRTRTGDCNEHTVLYTALARAVDIPTRIAIGLVYSDVLNGFGYHAWPEVYLGGLWYPMDPTLGQETADATHIKLLNGSISAWAQLITFIGQIELDVIACE